MFGRDNSEINLIENFLTFFLNHVQAGPYLSVLMLQVAIYIYSFFIEWDAHIFTPKNIQPFVQVPQSIEKLGYIEHIFSSKNAVLTENSLVFKMCSVGDKIYGSEEAFTDKKTTVNQVPHFAFRDPRLYEDITAQTYAAKEIQELFLALSLCQSAKHRKKKDDPIYMNTEEKALLKAAEAFGFNLLEKTQEKKKVMRIKDSINNKILEYKCIGNHNHEETQRYGVLVRS